MYFCPMPHSPHHLILVRPACFGFNTETAASNAFQKQAAISDANKIANEEFENLEKILSAENISFTVFENVKGENTPDAVFPNNWFSTHADGKIVLYPMMAKNRRMERNPLVVEWLKKNYPVSQIIDLTKYEAQNTFLEGTGSIVFDHTNKTAYACESPRTNIRLFEKLCDQLKYTPVSFCAFGPKGEEVYHTNVVMSIGEKFILICLESIENILERKMTMNTLEKSGKTIIPISFSQMNGFAGNMLEVYNSENKLVLLMSSAAFHSLEKNQLNELSSNAKIVHIPIPVIETLGGGSIRCMLAGVHFS